MTMAIEQLDFFPATADEINAKRIEEVAKSSDKVRKKLFAQHGELLKIITEMKNDFEHLKRAICRGNNEHLD
jgi:hypothetical protein